MAIFYSIILKSLIGWWLPTTGKLKEALTYQLPSTGEEGRRWMGFFVCLVRMVSSECVLCADSCLVKTPSQVASRRASPSGSTRVRSREYICE